MTDEREVTIRRLLPLVRTIARRILRLVPGSDLDDLLGDGAVGLIRAVDAFDAARGISLEHYARRVVAGAMLNGIRRLDPVSERVRRTVRFAERDRFADAAGRGAFPSEAELEQRHPGLGKARAEARRGTPLSLDAPMPPGERCAVDRRGDPAHIVLAAAEHERLQAALARLPARQRTIVVAHYFGDRSLRAISDELRVSPQRVSQLHLAAIERMRSLVLPGEKRRAREHPAGRRRREAAAEAIEPDADIDAAFPADHPRWQRDSSRSPPAPAHSSRNVPVAVRVIAFWDHRLREITSAPDASRSTRQAATASAKPF